MPLVEEEIGESLGNLIARNVSTLKTQLHWTNVNDQQGHWLLQSVFWLVSAKILRDKGVEAFEGTDLKDIRSTFKGLAAHYGSKAPQLGRAEVDALGTCAQDIARFADLSLATTESLAYVYENTLITKETRTKLGTHSTPSYLVDYIVGQLADWIAEIPENNRSVFEPACGHAGFLVAAMRLLTQLLPDEKAIASRRGPYLRARMHGTEIDPFALELARLSLTLSDIPNPDGWDLRSGDMFKDDSLREQAATSSILLANPPFANFSPEDKDTYAESKLRFDNRTAEVMWRTIPHLPEGGVFGFVMPQTLLHGKNATELRKYLLEQCELKEVCLFPDKVFNFSDAESAIVIGRRRVAMSQSGSPVRYWRFRESQIEDFGHSRDTGSLEQIAQAVFISAEMHSLRRPMLTAIWSIEWPQRLSDVAIVGNGFDFIGGDLPDGSSKYSDEFFPGAVRGFVHVGKNLMLHDCPKEYWVNVSPEAVKVPRYGTTTGVLQIVFNYAPTSRGPWRIKAIVDSSGHAVTSNFAMIRPTSGDWSIECLWALFNSPFVNC